ncbi:MULTISPECIES: hypothetical protein [Rhizobium]|uniref:Lipoprotein n=1 Tax=Rhizobium etli TaxID=29449 RepID=A0A7W6ZNR7_RHIET|nr:MULTISPECIES: hypothetical protein [Rhizobium]MBB4483224.1 hypothetical protein [Rhizobium etli]MBB4539052.1 hypothetical protein [Rhizobium etli]
MKKLAWFLSACQFFISGCAIHPAPENYSGRYTLNIVQSIRCEARDGFRQYLVNLLSDKDDERFKDQSSKMLSPSSRQTTILASSENFRSMLACKSFSFASTMVR